MDKYICHVCGYPDLEKPPWGLSGNSSSFDICPCCGIEYGYEDCQLSAYEKNKKEWITSGAKWFEGELKPSEWNLDGQLENIKKIPQSLLPRYLREKQQ
jgi:hypothetical protein